jgi:pimeloyl-ACP methyl ester carboxylesterase
LSGERSEQTAQRAPSPEATWRAAWDAALPLVDGCERGRAPGADPGVELAYLDWGGSGPLVVFLHANGFCAATWAPIAARLRRRFRVIALEARGHGDSTSVPPDADGRAYAWATLAGDVGHALAAILDRTGHDRIALAVGHSMGGALLTADALAKPGRFERLLLCDPVLIPPAARPVENGVRRPNPLAVSTRKRRDRFPSAAEAYAHCRSRALYAGFTPEALALYVGLGMRELDSGELALKCDREVEAAIFDQGGTLDLMPEIGSLTAELSILHAARSHFSLPYYQELVRRAPRASVESVDGDHLFPMETPELVLARIEGP